MRSLPREALGHDFPHGAVDPRIGFFPEPPLEQLVQMGPTLEVAVADEEVAFHIAHHALVLALGLRSGGPARPWPEPVLAGEIKKARMEPRGLADPMLQHRALLIVH